MNQDTFLYTLPQWFIFSAFATYLYGKTEQKKAFRIAGTVITLLLGIFSAYTIISGYFSSYYFLTPEEIINDELLEDIPQEMPFQAKLLPAYITFILAGLLAVPATVLELKNSKLKNLFLVIIAILSLFGFFVIVGTIRGL
ncbi:MAG: hypothetical protein PHH93_04015 [Prolixibacteraceae bacterium]|nr:hypothetical protein [Prolixibacteraceae bacterium]